MGIGELFWIIFAICFLFGFFWNITGRAVGPYGWYGNYLPFIILIFLLGWRVFGFIIHN